MDIQKGQVYNLQKNFHNLLNFASKDDLSSSIMKTSYMPI